MLRARRRSVLLSRDKPRRVIQDYAIDQFGELAGRKRTAIVEAHRRGHQLTGWHRRPNDAAGRWNASCSACNRMVVVCTETPEGFSEIYGPAVTQECDR